ncbi:anti-sigma factor antagonist [Alteromonadaceae bacterium M269]|nr:anti-sigma factor antagonist [Alteromonadaceae bacterium M269]
MSLEKKLSGDNTSVRIMIEEKFDFGKVHDFRDAYSDLPDSVHEVIVDLSHTEYMDSSALGMLLNMQKALNGKVSRFKIANCRPQVAKILKISRFDKKFDLS